MKRNKKTIIIVSILASFLAIGAGFMTMDQGTTITSSTGDGLVFTPQTSSGGYFFGVIIDTDASNNLTAFAVYDNTAGSGRTLIPQRVIATSATNRYTEIMFKYPLLIQKGVYITATCAGVYTVTSYVKSN